MPLAEGLNSSITFSTKRQDGYLKRITYPGLTSTNGGPSYSTYDAAGYGSSQTEGGDDEWSLRLKVKYDRGGPLKVTVSADYTDNDSTTANKLLGVEANLPGNFAGPAASDLPGTAFDPTGTLGFNFAGLYNFCIGANSTQIAARNAQALCGVLGTQFRPSLQQPALAGSGLLPYNSSFITKNVDTSYAAGNDFSHLTDWGGSITGDLQLTDNISLRSITAYRGLAWTSGVNTSGSPLNIADLSFSMNQQQVSQEIQLLGTVFDKKLNFVLGGYGFEESGGLHDFVTFGEGQVQIDGPNALATQNGALFGQVDWRPIDLVGVTFGGRYTVEAKSFTGGQQDLNGFNYKLFGCANASGTITPNAPFPLAPAVTCQQGLSYPNPNNPLQLYAPGQNHEWFSNFSPKVGVQLHPTEKIMAYASYSEGYKTGGWTTRLTNPLPTAQTFNPETADTWEIGVKSQLLDRRLQLDLAAFTTDYKNIQLNFQEGTSPTIRNAGNARIDGFEVESIASLTRELNVTASVGYLHSYYTSVLPGVLAVSGSNAYQAGTNVGAPLPEAPHWKFNLSPRYNVAFQNGASLLWLVDYTYTDASWNDAQRTYLLQRSASNTVNMSVTYAEPQGRWTLTAGGTNLSDDRYITSGNSNLTLGEISGSYNAPREGYVRFGIKF